MRSKQAEAYLLARRTWVSPLKTRTCGASLFIHTPMDRDWSPSHVYWFQLHQQSYSFQKYVSIYLTLEAIIQSQSKYHVQIWLISAKFFIYLEDHILIIFMFKYIYIFLKIKKSDFRNSHQKDNNKYAINMGLYNMWNH